MSDTEFKMEEETREADYWGTALHWIWLKGDIDGLETEYLEIHGS